MPISRKHYQHADNEKEMLICSVPSFESHSQHREQLLATLFFLSYFDILQGCMKLAHAHLKSAHAIFSQGKTLGFDSFEATILSWIRLLDARAVPAGGEGLLLCEDEEQLLIQPMSVTLEADKGSPSDALNDTGDIEDVLFEVLYQPGIVFFQKVQSFTGRISKIDQYHRSRGTVEDETEVMSIAAQISKDLRALYENRPRLMDVAIEGKLSPPFVSAALSFAVTRSFRTYISNYYACKIHLHRVAYRVLPLSKETAEALDTIRYQVCSMVDSLVDGETLPVNMLWPLLMLGAEEKSLVERDWIRRIILSMKNTGTNAKITAQVLREVQERQDNCNARLDIRSVMHDVFDSCFAIV
jgi:hypothetical protein